jgi:molybdate transport system substrate-binding protein
VTSKSILLTLLAIVALLAAACGSSGSSSAPESTVPSAAPATAAPSSAAPASASAAASSASTEVIVFGAASLKGVLDKAKTAYEAANPGVTLTVSTDSSAALATQIQQGAPADVLLSADTKNPQTLADAGLTTAAPIPFAGNKLTIITPTDNKAGITSPKDLAKSGIKVIAAGDDVPITKYATQLVANLAKEPGYPADFVAKYGANVASKEDNVKGIVAKIELGEGDAGIVYVTDAKASTKVSTVDVPDTANVPATYAGVVIKASQHVDAATAFQTWFDGPDGQAILAAAGFLPSPS